MATWSREDRTIHKNEAKLSNPLAAGLKPASHAFAPCQGQQHDA